MWKQALFRPCLRPRVRLGIDRSKPAPRRYISQTESSSAAPSDSYLFRNRAVNILVAFVSGCSVYFFLDDPRLPPYRPSLSPREFTSTKVISNENSGPNTKLLKVSLPQNVLPPRNEEGNFDPIWSVYIKDDDIQVERAYTPLNGLEYDGSMMFWIKKYPSGEVGRWLHQKNTGDTLELRGPLKTWPWKEDQWEEIIMISGGTGITPFVQLFNTVISKSSSTSNTRYTLVHSSRIPEELPPTIILKPMLDFSLENPQRFSMNIFVDEDDGSKPPIAIPTINKGWISEQALVQCLSRGNRSVISWWNRLFASAEKPPSRRILFLVCGPEPMVNAIAGPYGRNHSQGSVGGILKKMGYTSKQVYKL